MVIVTLEVHVGYESEGGALGVRGGTWNEEQWGREASLVLFYILAKDSHVTIHATHNRGQIPTHQAIDA